MKYPLPLLVLLCLGCETVIEVSPPKYDSEPVVTSFFSPDSIWSVRIHKSLGITVKRDANHEYISNASVRIMDGSNTIDILSYQGDGRYVSSRAQFPIDRIQYTLRVDFPDRASIQAVSAAPLPVVITDYSIKALPSSPESDPFSYGTKYQLRIVFSDINGVNFYRIGVYRRQQNPSRSDPDSVYRGVRFDGFTSGWSCGYPASPDAVEIIGGGSGVECREFVVTDRLFDGKSYSWGGTTVGLNNDTGRRELRLIISSLSEDYYRYLQSMERNFYHDPLTEQPSPVYSNISGGLGVFAGYTSTYLILPMPSED